MKELSSRAAHLITSVEEVLSVPQCLSEEYEDYLRRSHEDFQPLSRIFTKTIFTPEEPRALYKFVQDLELSAAKEAVKAMRNLQAIIQCKDPKMLWDTQPTTTTGQTKKRMLRIQNKEAEYLHIELTALAQRMGRHLPSKRAQKDDAIKDEASTATT
ncbi:hypothetical protein Tco_1093582 [Tanacetum coccineum]|uniref:Uncharacterized protein n=1 Tax=Tanacetum coccineum TaxID=301880 RepID=A0ABQ5ID38_9ASTR